MFADSGIFIYAELLSNIRQVSVVVTLGEKSDSTTSAGLINSGTTIKIQHQGKAEQLKLPGRARHIPLKVPSEPVTSLSWRLPLESSDANLQRFRLEDQPLPWSAQDLTPYEEVACLKCKRTLVARDVVKVWKDMPSENWAEMMEFWHCHKPLDHGQTEDTTGVSKGYGANSSINAQKSVGLVDVLSIVLSPDDCDGISVNTPLCTFD